MPLSSVRLAQDVLAVRPPDEGTARKILEAAFGGDPRLVAGEDGWTLSEPAREASDGSSEAPLVLLLVTGRRPAPRASFEPATVAAIRIEGGEVSAACGGDIAPGRLGDDLREAVREALRGAVPLIHDPPGALVALERWLDEPLDAPISLRRLAQARLGMAAGREFEALAARLGLSWRSSEDPLDAAEVLARALEALRRPGETLESLRAASLGPPPVDWSRFAFDRAFLREIPAAPGTYRFLDAEGKLLYVGRSSNLRERISSYFRAGAGRSARVRSLLEALHRIEVDPLSSDLEAMLREAAAIRRKRPQRNVQRTIRPRGGRRGRLRSILVLEPAAPPYALRAYLLRDGRLVDRVAIGPRGGGLKRIERALESHFFSGDPGPMPLPGPDVDVEIVARWLARNRDRAVAFDPTHLRTSREVIARLRLFLDRGDLFEPDGTPTTVR